MKDWNLRAILRRIWGEQLQTNGSWAIQKDVDPIEQAFWEKRNVEILELDLEEYIELLRAAVDERIAEESRNVTATAFTAPAAAGRTPTTKPPPSPYRGLRSFTEADEDAAFFFGRQEEVEIVAANLLSARLTLLYGPSGVGKSSVLLAGVVSSLRKRSRDEPRRRRRGGLRRGGYARLVGSRASEDDRRCRTRGGRRCCSNATISPTHPIAQRSQRCSTTGAFRCEASCS